MGAAKLRVVNIRLNLAGVSTMVSGCANPSCAARFKYLHEGQLFAFDRSKLQKRGSGDRVFYWLCPRCASNITLIRKGEELEIVPRSNLGADISSGLISPTGAAV